MHVLDYLVIGIYVLAAVGLGVYFGRRQDRREFLTASNSMGRITVGLSVMATLFSSNSFVMYPSASYGDSLRLGLTLVSHSLIAPFILWVFIPMYARLRCETAYEYLERRFHVSVRCLASGLFILLRIGWMASATFAASLVVAGVAGFSQQSVIIGLGVVSILYTMLGGLRAVMWTDVLQFFVFSGTILASLLLLHSISGSGLPEQLQTYFAGRERLLFDFTPSATLKFGSWAILIGIFLEALSAFGTDQVAVQRYIAAKSEHTSQSGFLINLLGIWLVVPALLLIGVGLFGHFQRRPQEVIPLLSAHIAGRLAEDPSHLPDDLQSIWRTPTDADTVAAYYQAHPEHTYRDMQRFRLADQAMPQFVRLHFPPGMKGLFLAALMAAIMSSIDSGVHSITTAFVVDIRDRLAPRWKPRTEFHEVAMIRGLIVMIGGATVVLACFVGPLGDVFDIGKKLTAAFGGPLLAVFLLGLFSRRSTSRGVFVGVLLSAIATLALMYAFPNWFSVWFWPVGFLLACVCSMVLSVLEGSARNEPWTFYALRERSLHREDEIGPDEIGPDETV